MENIEIKQLDKLLRKTFKFTHLSRYDWNIIFRFFKIRIIIHSGKRLQVGKLTVNY
jgi:hypothetical protein